LSLPSVCAFRLCDVMLLGHCCRLLAHRSINGGWHKGRDDAEGMNGRRRAHEAVPERGGRKAPQAVQCPRRPHRGVRR
jgi:hypothetical protein